MLTTEVQSIRFNFSAIIYNSQHTYPLGGDLDTYLLDCLSKFFGLYGSVVVKIEIFECLNKDSLLALAAACLLG